MSFAQYKWRPYLFLFLAIAAFMAFLQWSPTFPDPDAFFHARSATLMRDTSLTFDTLPSLSATILAQSFTDQYFLYHLILIPFVTVFDLPQLAVFGETGPLVGIKVLAAIGAALVFAVLFFVLRRLRVPYPGLLTFVALVTEPFVFRMNLGKTSSFVVVVMLVAVAALIERRYKLLFAVSAIWAWLHGSFLLAPLFAAIMAGVDFLRVRATNAQRPSWRAILAPLFIALAGITVGTIINPYFPRNIGFILEQSILIPLANPAATNAGGEWFPSDATSLFGNATILFLTFTLTLPLFIARKQPRESWFLFFVTLFLFVLTARSRRTIEYLTPVMILFMGVAIREGRDLIIRMGDSMRRWLAREPKLNWGLLSIIGVLLLTIIVRDGKSLVEDYRGGFAFTKFKGAATWLREHTPRDTIVFHTSWDEWPMLFYWNQWNRYLVGLDPRFMARKDWQAFQAWKDVVEGKDEDALPDVIAGTRAFAVFAAKKQGEFMKQIDALPARFEKAYDDEETAVYLTRGLDKAK